MRLALPVKPASITPTLASASAPSPPAPAVSGNWLHSDNDGDAAGLGLGLNIPLGPFLATVGGKGIYTNPKQGDEGYAAAVGGGLQWKIGDSFRLYGDYYYSPDSLSSGIDSYQEANVGASWTIMRPLSIRGRLPLPEPWRAKMATAITPSPTAHTSAPAPASNLFRRGIFLLRQIFLLVSIPLCVIVFLTPAGKE